MLTTLDSSPTCSSTTSAILQPTSCTSPDTQTTTEQQREPTSPSKHADSLCAKHPSSAKLMRHNSRHMPYPADAPAARSPGSCSSDGDSVQSDADNQDPVARNHSKVKRIAANSRERKRMHTVNSAFDQLRDLVPTYPSNRKLSKIDTLRLACTYIQDLVSLLQHQNAQAIQGDDVTLYHQPPFAADGFSGYPVAVKQEMAESYPPFSAHEQHFRMPLRFPTDACPAETYPSSASESDSASHSPPHQFIPQQVPPSPSTPLGSRPPPLTRVTSEGTASIHTRMAEASISGSPQQQQALPVVSCSASNPPHSLPPPPPPATSMYQRQVNITSPLAMHSVHSTTPNLLPSGLGHHSPPPVWQRPTLPNSYAHGHPLYGQ